MVHVWVWFGGVDICKFWYSSLEKYSPGGTFHKSYLFHLYTGYTGYVWNVYGSLVFVQIVQAPPEEIFGEPDFGRLEVLVLQTNWTPPKTNR